MEPVREARRFFADKAGAYRASPSHGNPADLARMLAWLAPRPGERALDVATGGGHTARALAEAGCEVTALDATPSMAQALRRQARTLAALLGDAHALPFREGAFGIVSSRIAPHHFADLQKAVGEMARVLGPGGRLYVFDLTTPDDPRSAVLINTIERLRDPSHVQSWSPGAWRSALAGAGLVPERLETPASELDLEPWLARAAMPADREREVRRLLADHQPESLGGYGLTPEGRLRVPRVELLAHKP